MIIVVLIFIMTFSYAITFKDDVPVVLVKRSLILFGVIFGVLNIKVIINYILDILKEVL